MRNFLYLMLCVLLFSCNHPSKRYAENNNIKCIDTLIISFNYDNIVDIVYSPDDNCIFVEYDDIDVFDYDNLAYLTNRKEWYGDYVSIDIDDNLFKEFIKDYYSYDYSDSQRCVYRNNRLNDKYRIIQYTVRFNDSVCDYIFEIVKYDSLKK